MCCLSICLAIPGPGALLDSGRLFLEENFAKAKERQFSPSCHGSIAEPPARLFEALKPGWLSSSSDCLAVMPDWGLVAALKEPKTDFSFLQACKWSDETMPLQPVGLLPKKCAEMGEQGRLKHCLLKN